MLEYIKHEANRIEDELWALAKSEYGLERDAITLERIQATVHRFINAMGKDAGIQRSIEVAPNIEEIEFGMAWAFVPASLARDEHRPEMAVKMLSAAAEALATVRHTLKWKQLIKEEFGDNSADALKMMAAALARMRHAENYSLRADAIKYWRENIDPSLSASKAANELVRVVPLSHKKLAEVVSAEKKKQ